MVRYVHMAKAVTQQKIITSVEAMERFGAELGARLRGGEVIELASDLGGGKTTLTRGLARGAGSADHVASPTFTISREYDASKFTIHHFDFYRLHEPGLMSAELHERIGDPKAVVVVEWSDIVQHVLPDGRLKIAIAQTSTGERQLTVTCPDILEYLLEEAS